MVRRRQIRVGMTEAQRQQGGCTLAGKKLRLSRQQTDVLTCLLMADPKVWVTVPEIISFVWPNPDDEPGDSADVVKQVLWRLRKKRGIPIIHRYGHMHRIPRERRDYDDLHFCRDKANCKSLYGGLCKGCEMVRRGKEPRLLKKRRTLLEYIRDHPRSTQCQMGEALGRKQQHIHQSLVILEEMKLVKISYRATVLTSKGLALINGELPVRQRNTIDQRVTTSGCVLGLTRGIPKARRPG